MPTCFPWKCSLVCMFCSIACSHGSGKHPQLMPSTPRWAVANGAGVILSVCDEEVARYGTAHLTAAAVPALLLPPPTTALDEHLVAGLPALEPYARLFHRYSLLKLFATFLLPKSAMPCNSIFDCIIFG